MDCSHQVNTSESICNNRYLIQLICTLFSWKHTMCASTFTSDIFALRTYIRLTTLLYLLFVVSGNTTSKHCHHYLSLFTHCRGCGGYSFWVQGPVPFSKIGPLAVRTCRLPAGMRPGRCWGFLSCMFTTDHYFSFFFMISLWFVFISLWTHSLRRPGFSRIMYHSSRDCSHDSSSSSFHALS